MKNQKTEEYSEKNSVILPSKVECYSTLQIVSLNSGQELEQVFADYSMLVFVLKGYMRVTPICARNSYAACPKEMFLIPQGRIYYIEILENTTLLLCSIPPVIDLFQKSPLKVYAPYLKKLPEELKHRGVSWLPVHPVLFEEVEHTVRVFDYFKNSNYFQDKKRETFIVYIANLYTPEEIAYFGRTLMSEDMEFLAMILDNYCENITIPELIECSGMSSCTFYRKFKKAFGINVGYWLTKKKIQCIVEDLTLSESSIAEIAQKHQMTPNHLAKFSNHHFGMPPSELRRQLKEKYRHILIR